MKGWRKMRKSILKLEKEIERWKKIANDLWWWLDDLSGYDAREALSTYPELGETEEYLQGLLDSGYADIEEDDDDEAFELLASNADAVVVVRQAQDQWQRNRIEHRKKDNLGKTKETDTDNFTTYALTCNTIRDFCEKAIESGELPTDEQIGQLINKYEIISAKLKLMHES